MCLPSFEKPVPLQETYDQHVNGFIYSVTHLSMTTAGVWEAMLYQMGARKCLLMRLLDADLKWELS